MRLLIGIMYTIENEFEACIEAIQMQTYQNFEYFVIKNKPNKEAHHLLYTSFMNNAESFQLFIKVDADMVLSRHTFFEEIVAFFKQNPDTDDLEIMVHDFFTGEMIFGLHIYSNRYRWEKNNEKIFVDFSSKKDFKRVQDKDLLAPAAYHCPDPSPLQAFHFGVHKAIKVMQKGIEKRKRYQMLYHWENIEKTKQNYFNKRELSYGFATLGAEVALRNNFTYEQADFNDEILLNHFSESNSFGLKQIDGYLHKIHIPSFTFLHPNLRRDFIYYKYSDEKFSFTQMKRLLQASYYELVKPSSR